MKKFSFLIFLFPLIFAGCQNQQKVTVPRAENGVLNLKFWDFEKNGMIPLNGSWDFYWHQLLEPSYFRDSNIQHKGADYEIPSYWNGKIIDGKEQNGNGYATFRLRIITPKNHTVNGIVLKEILSSYKLWLNGKLLVVNGKVGKTIEQSTPLYVPVTIPFVFVKDTNEIVIQASNYFHRKGGFFEEIMLGSFHDIFFNRIFYNAFDLFLFGSLVIMAIYHFGLFFLRRKDKSTLFFGLLCLLVGFRVLVTREQFLSLALPDLSWELNYKIEYLTLYLAPLMFITFFHTIFPSEMKKWIVRVFQLTGGLFSILALVTPARIYSHTALLYQMIILFGIAISIYSLFKALIRKREGANILFIGILVLLITAVNDILYIQGVLKTIELASLGLFVFILCQSFVLSHRFSRAFVRNEELTVELEDHNKNLEQLVDDRTAEIHQRKEEIQAQADQLEVTNKELEKLSIVASETDNAVIIANVLGEIEWVNAGFEKLYGFNLENFIKERGGNIIKASSNLNILDAIMDCLEMKKSVDYSSQTITRDGNKLWIQTTLTPITDENGDVIKLVAIDSDISKIKEAEEAINLQNEEIRAQRDKLEEVNGELHFKNEEITDSITYAKLIQDAILPRQKLIKENFPESFIFFKPRDIVSGDFYWFSKQDDYLFIATVDCTGHGVPGGFMSMIGHSSLNEIVKEKKIFQPSLILDYLNNSIVTVLHQGDKGMFLQDDGMDISLCRIDMKSKELQFACAGQSVYIITDGKLKVVRGDIYSIGENLKKKCEDVYTNYSVSIEEGMSLYLASDGYQDQFGGIDFTKFNLTNLQNLFLENQHLSMNEQAEVVKNVFENWKGNRKQIDDVLVVGIRF